jgi:cold shock CspA family protein
VLHSMRRSTGEVANFDDDSGLGLITADDGSSVPFHCVAIVDGTRSVRTGARVRFRLTQRLGRAEAADIEPLA